MILAVFSRSKIAILTILETWILIFGAKWTAFNEVRRFVHVSNGPESNFLQNYFGFWSWYFRVSVFYNVKERVLTNFCAAYDQCPRLLPFNAQFRITLKLRNFKESQFNANQVGAVCSQILIFTKNCPLKSSRHKIL